jgi:hypothetical protein
MSSQVRCSTAFIGFNLNAHCGLKSSKDARKTNIMGEFYKIIAGGFVSLPACK